MVEKLWQWERGTSGHVVSAVREQGEEHSLAGFLPSLSVQFRPRGVVSLRVRVDLTSFVKLLWEHPHRRSQRRVS